MPRAGGQGGPGGAGRLQGLSRGPGRPLSRQPPAKKWVAELLARPQGAASVDLADLPVRAVLTHLGRALARPQSKWPAVSAMGELTARLAQEDLEAGREVMRRLVWSLNEESGAIGFGAPEAMGEIMARHQGLAREFLNLLISYLSGGDNFLDHPPLLSGAIWGLGRVAQAHPDLVQSRGGAESLEALLGADEAQVRGLAAWSLGYLADARAGQSLAGLLEDASELSIFTHGKEETYTVGTAAREARQRLDLA